MKQEDYSHPPYWVLSWINRLESTQETDNLIKCSICGRYEVTENGDICEVCLAEMKHRGGLVVE